MKDIIDEAYLKGFNTAYLMAQYEATLIEKLISKENSSSFFKGLTDGRNQYLQEKFHDRMNELNCLNKGRDLDLER